MCGGCGLGSAKARSSPYCSGCFDVVWEFLHIAADVVLESLLAKRIVMATSRLFGATAACVILLSCAAGHRKSSWDGCVKAAVVIRWHMESILRKLCSTK